MDKHELKLKSKDLTPEQYTQAPAYNGESNTSVKLYTLRWLIGMGGARNSAAMQGPIMKLAALGFWFLAEHHLIVRPADVPFNPTVPAGGNALAFPYSDICRKSGQLTGYQTYFIEWTRLRCIRGRCLPPTPRSSWSWWMRMPRTRSWEKRSWRCHRRGGSESCLLWHTLAKATNDQVYTKRSSQ